MSPRWATLLTIILVWDKAAAYFEGAYKHQHVSLCIYKGHVSDVSSETPGTRAAPDFS